MRVLIATAMLCLIAFVTKAEAHGRHHYRHHHHHYYVMAHAQHREISEAASEHAGLTRVRLESGQAIVVASAYADRFAGFLNALYHREGRLPDVECYSPTGHMRNSLHHWGGACDVGQRSRNVAWHAMYHVGDLARQYGLTDGCVWHSPDCGHVDVSGVGGSRYASNRRRHYATTRHHYRHYAKG